MRQRWSHVSFLHWPYPAAVVQGLLPPTLEVETAAGSAWVGLVPFLMEGVRLPGLPPVPWASRFPETNVRTYVRGADGRAGIWFFSLDAARLGAVVAARATYQLPYFWAGLSVRLDGTQVHYQSRRRWPGPPGARCHARVEVGAPFAPEELGALDHFLTARYRLYTVVAGRAAEAEAEHAPWSLARARLVTLEEDLVEAAGLPRPGEPPLVHYSPGVRVRVGRWRYVHPRAARARVNRDPPATGCE
jgi:uncharacterized protein YqjF (DUF2071 family)